MQLARVTLFLNIRHLATERIETLLAEQRRFSPTDSFTAQAHVPTPARTSARAETPKVIGRMGRSNGKIMRRLLKDIAEGRALGDTTTLADPAVVAKLRDQYENQDT